MIRKKVKGKVVWQQIIDYGYTEPTDHYTQTIWVVWYLLFIPVWFKILLIEKVPSWAIIQRACTGYTDWKSSRPELIDLITKK